MGGELTEWSLAAFAALATIGASYLVVRAGHRDRDKERHERAERRVDKIAVEVRHTQKSAQPPIRGFYDGEL